MADTITPKMGLTKPEVGASANSWGNKLNENFNIIDTKVLRNTIQWVMELGDEVPASSSGYFVVKRFNNAGVEVDQPFVINRQTGDIIVLNNLNVSKDLVLTGNITKTGTLTLTVTQLTVSGILAAASAVITGAVSAASAAISGALTAASATISGLLTSASATISGTFTAGGLSTFNSDAKFNAKATYEVPGAVAQLTPSNTVFQGSQPFLSFLIPGTWLGNLGMDGAGNFYVGGGTYGAVAYQLWTKKDFSILPAVNMRVTGTLIQYGPSGSPSVPAGFVIEQVAANGGFVTLWARQLQWQRGDGAWINVGAA